VNNLYGVDIDAQAVEVTKLSLLLKVLEEETGQLTLGFERALPDLSDNIQCGNSLIGWDYFEGQLIRDEEEVARVNPFEWEQAFPEVFTQGGFDAVIGNPPYIRIQAMKEWAPGEVNFYKEKYISASKGNYDIYVVFVEKGYQLLNEKGLLGFILPHKFFNSQYGRKLREIISIRESIVRIVHFGDKQVFEKATTYTCLLFLSLKRHEKFLFVEIDNINEWIQNRKCNSGLISSKKYSSSEWNFIIGDEARIFNKLEKYQTTIANTCSLFVGLQTSADKVFLFKETSLSETVFTKVHSKQLKETFLLESKLLQLVVRSGEIGRYYAKPTALVLFPYEKINDHFLLIKEKKMKEAYPKTWDYLLKNKKLLENREHGKFKNIGWYQLYPKNLDLWEQPKIMIPYMVTRLSAYYDLENYYFVNVTTGGFGLTIDDESLSYPYLTGLLNSKLIDWFFKKVSTTFHGGYYAANKQFLDQLPIYRIDLGNSNDIFIHERIVSLVYHMIELHKRIPNTPFEQEQLNREIAATDAQIDRLVYDLYGLTEEEIKIVEGEVK